MGNLKQLQQFTKVISSDLEIRYFNSFKGKYTEVENWVKILQYVAFIEVRKLISADSNKYQ